MRDGVLTRVARYRLTFSRAGRGYRLRMDLIDSEIDGPGELLRLIALGDDLLERETLDISLSDDGEIMGVSEQPDAQADLKSAIDALKSDQAFASLPKPAQQAYAGFLDRLASMDAAERAELASARAAPLLQFAGAQIAPDGSILRGNQLFRIDRTGENGRMVIGVLNTKQQSADDLIQYQVSPHDGLSWRYLRKFAVGEGVNRLKTIETMSLSLADSISD